MRITLVTDGLTPWVTGGMQRHSFLLIKYLSLAGVAVDVISIRSKQNESESDVLYRFPKGSQERIHITLLPFEDIYKFPGHYLYASYLFSKRVFSVVITRPKSDFIYTKGFTGWQLLRNRRALILPSVGVKFHGMNMFQKQSGWKGELEKYLFRWPVRWVMGQSDVVFSYGGKITSIIEQSGIDSKKIISIPAGIEKEWCIKEMKSAPEFVPNILFVGRYDKIKGLPELYKAALKFKSSAVQFHFVGPIPDSQRLIHSNFIYHGEVRDERALIAIYDQCHFLVCPSYSEGMPNVILEAMARGLPVVATNTGATNLLVQSDTGILLSHPSPNLIESALRYCIEMHAQQYMQMSMRCAAHVREHFLWEKITKQYIDALELMCHTRNHG
jgi:glycosyltransferase involved in cell wall biosynthesis